MRGLAAQARGFGEDEAQAAADLAARDNQGGEVSAVEHEAYGEGFVDGALGRRNKYRHTRNQTRADAAISGQLDAYDDAYFEGRAFAEKRKPSGGPEAVTFRLRTATGHEVTFDLPNDAEAVEDFRKRLVGKARKFYASTPDDIGDIGKFVEESLNVGDRRILYDLGPVTEVNAARIRDEAGIELEGAYRRELDNYGVRHTSTNTATPKPRRSVGSCR